METELKFRVLGKLKGDAIEAVDWAPYHLETPEIHRLHDTLLDTPNRVITRQGYGLRIRRDNDTLYITLKGPGSAEGARHQREEWQEPVSEQEAADFARWPEAIRARLQALGGEQDFQPLVEVQNRRRTWEVRRDATLVAELAFDRGEIQAGTATEKLREIEVETKGQGTDQDLDYLAQRLKQRLAVVDQPQTKLARGLALLARADGAGAAVEDEVQDVAMAPYAPLSEAGRAVLREQWSVLQANEPGVRAGDPEAVHDMRVATRRLRAILDVLGESVYDPEQTGRLRRGLRRLAAGLGVVRDAEVWMQAVEAYAATLAPGERGGLDPLLRELHRRRDAGRVALLEQLSSKRTRQLMRAVEQFVTVARSGLSDRESGPLGAPLRVRDAAGSALWARMEEVNMFEPAMPAAPVAVLHDLRIACKHLRYTLELFSDALGPDAKGLRNQLVAAQDHIGSLHDADIALPLVDQLLAEEPHNAALQSYRLYLQGERDRLWASMGDVWAAIGSGKFRKRLAGCIAKL